MEIQAKSRTVRPDAEAIKRLRLESVSQFRLHIAHRCLSLGLLV
jgi:hypothetical protein